jgi:hypothetical protein
MTDGDDEHSQTAEAFSTVGSEVRLSILRELWEADRALGFSELRGMVGMRDSAQFNYHLQKLTPRFVRKSDDGYQLAWPGKYVVRAIIAGTLVGDRLDPFPTEATCIDCHEPLVASYDGDRLSIRCPACERLYSTWPFPPGALVDRDSEALLDAYDQWVRHEFSLGVSGVCADCGGCVDRALHVETSPESPLIYMAELQSQPDAGSDVVNASERGAASDRSDDRPAPARVQFQCQRCRKQAIAHPGMVLLTEPAVSDLYRQVERPLKERRYWTLPWAVDDALVTVLETDPPSVEISVTVGDRELTATVDDSLTVTQIHRPGSGS